MSRKTGKVLCIVAAFLVNLAVYIGLLWSSVLILDKVQDGDSNRLLNFLMGFVVYSVFIKIKPLRVKMMLERYSEELTEEHSKK